MTWDCDSARDAFANGNIQTWIEAYLQVPEWENLGLLRRVLAYSSVWSPPRLVEINDLRRIAGPGEEFTFQQDPDRWESEIQTMLSPGIHRDSVPPVIAWIDPDGSINLADGNHRVDALARAGFQDVWAIVHETPLRSPEEIALRWKS